MNNAVSYFDPQAGLSHQHAGPHAHQRQQYVPDHRGAGRARRRSRSVPSGANHIMPCTTQIAALMLDFGLTLEQAMNHPRIDASDRGSIRVDPRLGDQVLTALAEDFELEIAQLLVFPETLFLPVRRQPRSRKRPLFRLERPVAADRRRCRGRALSPGRRCACGGAAARMTSDRSAVGRRALRSCASFSRRHRKTLVLISALVLSSALGSIHAFSVLLDPLEVRLAASRAEIAPAYSIGLACLTLAVLVGHHLFRLIAPAALAWLAGVIAAGGLAMAALATGPAALWIGYGLVFGFANGVGYGFALHLTNLAFDRGRGLAMGSVTAVYAIGASGAAALLDGWIMRAGVDGALLGLAGVLLLCSLFAGTALWLSRFDGRPGGRTSDVAAGATGLDRRRLSLCWLIYGTGVAAGLMAMGHAAGIVTASGGGTEDGLNGTIAITSANAVGGFAAGYLADRRSGRILLASLGAIAALALSMLAIAEAIWLVIAALAAVGFTYGAIISLFPIVTASIFGRDLYAIAYGRIFTSWGLAGLAAPWFAGILYSRTGAYGLALMVAAGLAALSGCLALLLPGAAATRRVRPGT